MGNWLSRNSSEGQSSTERDVRGDFSGNSGSGNQFNSGNITNYYGGTIPPDKQSEILRCLYKSSYESHRCRVREPVRGTCAWVTEHPKYREWIGKKLAGLLWLSADPGYGKSVMASFLVGHLKEVRTGAVICYFFFKDDNEEQKSATLALCAILHQLFSQRNFLCRYAEEALKGKGERFTGEVDTLWDILVKAVADERCGEVICVVDALDECENVTLARLIQYVNHLPGPQTSNTPLKFLVTSRPYHNIEKELGARETTIRLRGEEEVSAITTDVTRVIDNGIAELERIWRNPGELKYLRDLLLSSADRTFLWVALVIEILKSSEVCSAEAFTGIISTTPHDLAEFYTKILDQSSDPKEARRVLHIVVAAARPLTLGEMSIALRVGEDKSIKNPEDIPTGFDKTVKSFCGLFVRVIDSKIYLVHQTAREFLMKGSLPGHGKWQYTLCPEDSNVMIADTCISYLSREEFAGAPLALDDLGRVSEEAVDDYLQKYTFLDYAARHWADNFRDSQDQGMKLFEFTRKICEPGSGRCQTWFQVYWFKTRRGYLFPKDFTHLMTASFLGQGPAVDRLLEEAGDINARSEIYGTALNIAATQRDESMTKKLLRGHVKAYLGGMEYDILHTKKSELERAAARRREIAREIAEIIEARELIAAVALRLAAEDRAIEFLKRFCLPDTPDPDSLCG